MSTKTCQTDPAAHGGLPETAQMSALGFQPLKQSPLRFQACQRPAEIIPGIYRPESNRHHCNLAVIDVFRGITQGALLPRLRGGRPPLTQPIGASQPLSRHFRPESRQLQEAGLRLLSRKRKMLQESVELFPSGSKLSMLGELPDETFMKGAIVGNTMNQGTQQRLR